MYVHILISLLEGIFFCKKSICVIINQSQFDLTIDILFILFLIDALKNKNGTI